MRRPFPSKWCRVQHTATHLGAQRQPGITAQHGRSGGRTCSYCLVPDNEEFLYRAHDFFFPHCVCPVRSRRGEGGLQAASEYGLWRTVVFPSLRQLTCHREVTQRFVSTTINCSQFSRKCKAHVNLIECYHEKWEFKFSIWNLSYEIYIYIYTSSLMTATE